MIEINYKHQCYLKKIGPIGSGVKVNVSIFVDNVCDIVHVPNATVNILKISIAEYIFLKKNSFQSNFTQPKFVVSTKNKKNKKKYCVRTIPCIYFRSTICMYRTFRIFFEILIDPIISVIKFQIYRHIIDLKLALKCIILRYTEIRF